MPWRMADLQIAHIAIVVDDYDRAIDYYTNTLGFELIEDSPRGNGKRWVLVAPAGRGGANLLLARAANPGKEVGKVHDLESP